MDNSFRIQNANVVNVRGGTILERRTAIIQGDRIRSVGSPPSDWSGQTIDGTGLYLCPGLIDCHVHFFLDAGGDPRGSYIGSDDEARMATAVSNARIAIHAGITTMRDCGAPGPLMFQFQQRVERNEISGPHIISCGHALMRPKGHCHFLGGEVATVEELRRRIESHLEQGAGFVKLMASGGGLTPGTVSHEADLAIELMKEAADMAHANGVQITAHCHATESVERAIEADLDMIEHVSYVEPPGRYRYDAEISKRIRDKGIVVSPTVYCALQTARRFRQTGAAHNPGDVAAVERLEGRLTNARHFHRLGMKIIGGTDCGATNTPFNSLVDEIESYTEAGLSRTEALRTVTSEGASLMKLPKLGEVKEDYRADLILVEGNPLEDLEVLRAPRTVIKSGKIVHQLPSRD